MQINNISAQNSTNFGMAQLTKKGMKFASDKIGELPQYVDQAVYKKNILSSLLSDVSHGGRGSATMSDVKDVFEAGHTAFADKNATFVDKQILGSKKAIAKFLKQKTKTVSTADGVKYELEAPAKELVGQVLSIFDENVANPQLSAKKGSRVLELVSKYLPSDEVSPRHTLVTNKLFSRK